MIILGAGVSGICMAKKLDELGVRLDHTEQNSKEIPEEKITLNAVTQFLKNLRV